MTGNEMLDSLQRMRDFIRNRGKKQTVVVTGASAGLGRAIAHAFARRGARIALIARDRDRLQAVKHEVERLGGSALVLVADVAHAEQVEWAAAQTEEQLGPIDIWVNNAMVSVFSRFAEIPAPEFQRVTEVTYLGTVYGTMSALRRMLPRDHGVIVQVGSALSERSIPLQSAYCGAKHAIRGFTDSIRCELLHDRSKVHITTVQMPALNTPQFSWVKSRLPNKAQPVPPIYQPEVGAGAVVWASRHRRRELCVGLSTVTAMWADRVVPGILDRYLARTGFDQQQTDEPEVPNRPDNLWQTVPGPYAVRGEFGHLSYGSSAQLWFSERKWWGLGVFAAGIAALAAVRSLGNGRDSSR